MGLLLWDSAVGIMLRNSHLGRDRAVNFFY